MKNIKCTLIFDHRKKKLTDKGSIEIYISYNRKAYYISTGVSVIKKNFVAGQIVNQVDAKELNQRLFILYNKVQDEINFCISENIELDISSIRRKLKAVPDVVDDDKNVILEFCEEQEKMMGLAYGTLKHYYSLNHKLQEYGQLRRWSDLTAENICKFDAWLRQIKKKQSIAEQLAKKPIENISDAAVYNYHKCMKAILNRALLFDRIDVNPYDRLKGKFKRGDKENVEYLTAAEMDAIESLHPIEGTQMAIARDLFVFQMHTGLAYIDTQFFDIKNYYQEDGRWRTIGKRVKTGSMYITQLSDECERILERYGWTLPKIGNADYNKCLKALGAAVGIEKPLHTHLARHSFATRMRASGVDIQNVSKMLGHKDLKNTQRYAKVMPENVFAEFGKFEETKKKNKKSSQ